MYIFVCRDHIPHSNIHMLFCKDIERCIRVYIYIFTLRCTKVVSPNKKKHSSHLTNKSLGPRFGCIGTTLSGPMCAIFMRWYTQRWRQSTEMMVASYFLDMASPCLGKFLNPLPYCKKLRYWRSCSSLRKIPHNAWSNGMSAKKRILAWEWTLPDRVHT